MTFCFICVKTKKYTHRLFFMKKEKSVKKRKSILICFIVQLVFGTLGIAAFVTLAVGGEDIRKWVGALILAIIFIILGIINVFRYQKDA